MEDPRLAARMRRIFLAGLLILSPAAITAAVLVWLFRTLDGLLGPVVTQLAGRQIPGLGLLATIAIVFLLGLVSRNVIGNRLIGAVERFVQRVPVARSLYGSTREVVSSLGERPADSFKRVVALEYPRRGIWSVGFVTGAVSRLPDPAPAEELMTVFVPSSPIPSTGFLVLVPRAEARELGITVEQGVRLVMSGGLVRPGSWGEAAPGRTKA